MVGRVPLCVHGAGETKTGSVSSPGAEEGGRCLLSYLGETTPKHPATSPQSCSLPRAAVGGSTKGQEANCKQSGEGITRPGVWPHASEAMNFPTPAWKGREGVGEEKDPKQWGQFSTPQSASPQTRCQPVYLFVFPPHLQMGRQAELSKGYLR